ncbi:LOW QUALITY PROTEIN: condensin complex subunit 3 [Alligator sinensis]|uniref:LOW QUALITY PROTEIN: condensin complex subunit 3 n=1 Tax=Alligator sinensis TaxID=38654 RepID=A0A1U7SBM1_ALLSI|nr:LOW QUALITY PROTEIN: condensin complex subunit 3 [Alligator sinensis]
MGVDAELLSVRDAFALAQKPHRQKPQQNQAKLVAALRRTYAQLDEKKHFHEEFLHFLKYPMVVYKREPAVEQVINFAAKFVSSLYQADEEGVTEEEENNSLLNYLFNFLLESHNANSHAVRFRACQLVNTLLENMPENAQIDDELFDKINEAMLIRLKDKFPNVRIQAVPALSRLQDPKDENCSVVNVYNTLLENDSNSEVRRAVLSCIAPSAQTLPKIVGRIMDVKEAVRKLAYEVLAEKVPMKVLSIAQRVKLLQQGLNDRSDAVKEVVKKKLLQSWLRVTEGDVLELLHRLDVEDCPEVAVPMLNAMFSLSSISDLVQNCKNLDSRKMIPVEELTAENALYWRSLCEYLKSKGEEGEALLEQIVPEPAIYAEYLLSYLQSIPVLSEKQREDFSCIEHLMTKEFIGQQLSLLIGCMDTTEEGGRKRLLAVLQEILILPTTSLSLISSLAEILLSIIKDDDKRIETVAEIISEVREPIVTFDKPIDATEIRKQKLKLAEIKVKLFETKVALEECIDLQDFNRASVLKEKITELEHIKNDLIKEAEQPEIEEMRVEKNDPETLLKCLMICYELLKQMSFVKGIGSTTNGIVESLILPGITNVHPAVRNMAVLCLGCCALQDKDFAHQHLALLLQVLQIDDITVKLSALKAVFDQLMLFGIEPFKVKKTSDPESEDAEIRSRDCEEEENKCKEAEEETDTVHNLLQLLSSFLDSEFSELRTEAAEGLVKLMFSGRLIGARLLSRLVLLWYNPVTEDDTRLRHCLGVFFPLFAYANRANQECFEEAYLPTLRTLFHAPASSPLTEVDIGNVSELLVDLTRPSGLNPQAKNSQDYQNLTVHDSLAMKICNAILMDPTAPDVRIYAKALSSLELSKYSIKDLLILFDEILKKVKDKLCQRAIEKIKTDFRKHNDIGKDHSAVVQDTGTTTSEDVNQIEDEEKKATVQTPVNEDDKQNATRKMKSTRGKTNGGRRKVTTEAVNKRRRNKTIEFDSESGDEVPEPVSVPSSRPSRRAKTAAIEKTRMNLTGLINEAADE